MQRPTVRQLGNILQSALVQDYLSETQPLLIFFDLDLFVHRIHSLISAFPIHTHHAIAIKANPVISILKIVQQEGLGVECASPGELALAQAAGFSDSNIVYDSPVKSKSEIQLLLSRGIRINADNLDELHYISDCVVKLREIAPSLGIRVNTGMSMGDYKATSTSVRGGKFGVSVSDLNRFLKSHPHVAANISRLHVHTGSQGYDPRVLVQSIKRVVGLADRLNQSRITAIRTIDIGGGLPISYHPDEPIIGFADFVRMLRADVPHLFNYELITEYGRSVMASPGWAVSRVEYVKTSGGRRIVLCHAGADLFLRAAYMNWFHDFVVFDSNGMVKTSNPMHQDIAGPLCFSGDYLARRRLLPKIEPGDWLVIRDAGAYTFGMWSLYNSRLMPTILGYREGFPFEVLLRRWDMGDILRLWDRVE